MAHWWLPGTLGIYIGEAESWITFKKVNGVRIEGGVLDGHGATILTPSVGAVCGNNKLSKALVL
ncbi:hypothetical protein LguiA_028972 [Lonicera macranthoides]